MRPNTRSASVTAARDLGAARDVHLQRQHAPAERADRLGRPAVGARVAQPERDVGARLRQRDRARPPEAAGRAGDQRDLAADVEARRLLSRVGRCGHRRGGGQGWATQPQAC